MNAVDRDDIYDALIIGGGPAGMTAAIYLARARYRVLLLEKEAFGGQIKITSEVVNYPGIRNIGGEELGERMRRQAESFGAQLKICKAEKIDPSEKLIRVSTDTGTFSALGLLVATGARPRTLGFDGEARFRGRGVAYCATCDGEFYDGKEIFVIGGGYAAAEEAIFLTRYAKRLTMLVREDDFTCARSIADRVRAHERITVLTNTEIVSLDGEDGSLPSTIVYKNNKTGEIASRTSDDGFGVFVFVGYAPETSLLGGICELDGSGYVITGDSGRTSADGIFAAGDLCQKELRQVVTAVGDGAVAATALEKYIEEKRAKLGFSQEKDRSTPEKVEKIGDNGIFDAEMQSELRALFAKMKSSVILEVSDGEGALFEYLNELSSLSEHISLKVGEKALDHAPYVRIFKENGEFSGITFHGIPSGHEFTPFVLAICAVGGLVGEISADTAKKIADLRDMPEIKLLVTLSCSYCPETVTAAERIVLERGGSADVYDVRLFPDLREKYNVMSVPCIIIGEKILFGKKTIDEIVGEI